jgi:uncharacterized repeat protein (TIGR01451 family)
LIFSWKYCATIAQVAHVNLAQQGKQSMKIDNGLRGFEHCPIASYFLRALQIGLTTICVFVAGVAGAQVAITSVGAAFTQNFNSLPATGATTWVNNVTIPGWYFQRTGAGTTITAGSGSSATGGLYSFGVGTTTERALGAVSSGATGNVFYGVRLLNQTGTTVTSVRVSYVGEQWRRAATTAPVAQTVNFSYVTGTPTTGSLAEFQTVGTAVSQLDSTSPITALPTGALDGNAAANRVALSHTISGLSLANNSEIFLRWSDIDHPDFDHGLAIDDFSFTALSETNLTLSAVDAPDPVVAGSNITYTITANNLGPNAAPNATMTTTVPAGTGFVSIAAPLGWVCAAPAVGATGAISCSATSVASATSAQFDLIVQVAPTTAGGTSIPNNFSLSSDLADTVPGNETASSTTSVSALVFNVTPSAGAGGMISPSAVQSVPFSGNTTFTVTPNPGFTSSVGGTCGGALVGTTYTTNAITTNCTVVASFTPIVYVVSPSAGANGIISPATAQNVNSGATTSFTVTPNAGFTAAVGGTCGGNLVGTTYTTNAVTANCTVVASFTPIVYSVSPSAGANGTISPATAQNVNSGATTSFTVTSNAGFTAAVGGTCGGNLVGTTFTTNAVVANCTVVASFSPIVLIVTPSAGANGSISPATVQNVNSGATAVFTVTPNAGYSAIVGGTCGGALLGAVFTTSAITANCTVAATFSLIPLLPQTITNFTPPAAATLAIGATFSLSATGGASNNPVTFSSTSPSVCTVSGNTVTVVGAGSCQLQAAQAGNAQFEAASAVSASVQIALPAPAQATPVPTLHSWALLLLILGVIAVSQRRYQ